MRVSKSDREEAISKLRDWIKPGDTVYTVLDHVSRSGMSRRIRFVLLEKDDKGNVIDRHPNWAIGKAVGLSHAKRDGSELDSLRVDGCGMDMGSHVVYHLSYTLNPEGFGCIGDGCPSNDHSNGDRDYTPHKPEGLKPQCHHWHKDGGYALRHRWI